MGQPPEAVTKREVRGEYRRTPKGQAEVRVEDPPGADGAETDDGGAGNDMVITSLTRPMA